MSSATFANGDTNYVAKLNGNFASIDALIEAINTLLAGTVAGSASSAANFALFGSSVSVIGVSSYGCSGSGSDLTVATGYIWKPSLTSVLKLASPAILSFAGQGAATYYIEIDATGAPSRQATNSGEAIYSVVWTGSAFGTITRLAAIVFGAADDAADQVSTALGASYTTLDARLEAGEAISVAAAAAVAALGSTYQPLDSDLTALAGLTTAADKIPYFTASHTAGLLTRDTDGTLAANSDLVLATQKAVKTYVDGIVTGGAADVMIFKGVIDCSANPNYPAADAGALYKVSVAGKIGGASGATVELGDTLYCIADSTASGNQATVGSFWNIAQVNIDGAVVGPASATDGHVVMFDGATGKLVKDSGVTLSGTNTGDETTTTAGALILGATAKSTPVDADFIGLMDSAASNILKKLSWLNIKATLKTYFDTLYPSGSGTSSGTNTGDQSSVTGNAGTATALQSARTIGGTSFDGTANITQPVDIAAFLPGLQISASQKIYRGKVARALTFAANFGGSYFTGSANATGSTVFDVQKNGVSIGSVTIAAAGVVATFATSGGTTQSLAAGDILSILGPAVADATLADPSFTLAATR